TSLAGIKNADDNLAQLRKALDDLGLSATTNIIIAADHGFSTISKESKTSPSAKVSYDDTPKDFLPMGFLAIDLAKALDLPLFDRSEERRVGKECRAQWSEGDEKKNVENEKTVTQFCRKLAAERPLKDIRDEYNYPYFFSSRRRHTR